jgi:hypothetical protein
MGRDRTLDLVVRLTLRQLLFCFHFSVGFWLVLPWFAFGFSGFVYSADREEGTKTTMAMVFVWFLLLSLW